MVSIRNIFVAGVALCCSSALRVDEDPQQQDAATKATDAAVQPAEQEAADLPKEEVAESAEKYKKMVALEKTKILDNVKSGKSAMRALSDQEKLEGYEAVRAKLHAAAGVATKDLETLKSRAADYENKAKEAHSSYCGARKEVINVNKHLEDLATKSDEASQHVKDTEVSIGKAEGHASVSKGHLEVAQRQVDLAASQTDKLQQQNMVEEMAADEAKKVEKNTTHFWDVKINTKAKVAEARENYETVSIQAAESAGDAHAAQIEAFEANKEAAQKMYELKTLKIAGQ